ncbi:MAG: penicillin acylase family protein [Saprospiraceae bacterium]
MKRRIILLILILISLGILYLVNKSITIKGKQIPPLSSFFSPFTGFWQNAPPTKIDPSFTVKDLQLISPAQVSFDERMVPHIFAENLHDLFYIQGYFTAKDRLWQMDISTRASSGRLAEILGPDLIERDLKQRRNGLYWAAEKTVEYWKQDKSSFALIQAYVDGANKYIENLAPEDYPIEFKLLNYKPEPWSALKAAQFYKSMEETLNGKAFDIENQNIITALGLETYNYLFPEWNPNQSPVIPDTYDSISTQIRDTAKLKIPDDFNKNLGLNKRGQLNDETNADFLGSNNWAVAPQKTKSGSPILCNDPHLRLSLPSIWYEVQLVAPELNAYGVSFPGIPGIIIGFNQNSAWGSTNGSHDVRDWFSIKWTNKEKTTYRFNGEDIPVNLRIETIKVKGGEDIIDTVKYTNLGPVSTYEIQGEEVDLAMHWIANDTSGAFVWKTIWQFDKSKTLEDFDKAASFFGHPIQNFVFASTKGDIGLKVSGLIPIKSENNGNWIMDGTTDQEDWSGFVPDSLNPKSFNPTRGFVSSANQHSTYPNYPFYYSGHFNDYRGRYINRLLDSMNHITVEDMKSMQNNNYSILAEEALPTLLKHLDKTELNTTEAGLVSLLDSWNFEFNADNPVPAIFEAWMNTTMDLIWDEIATIERKGSARKPEIWRTLDLIENDPLNVFFDIRETPERETPQTIVTMAFRRAVSELSDKLDDTEFNWAEYKGTSINHLALIPAFSRQEIFTGGYRESINAVQKTAGPSWRMIVELSEQPKGNWHLPGRAIRKSG